ncbi:MULTISPECIES: hypothetical protein [Gammaproteobacteria]|uniref:hypothetical protein n=1 Tax=Gammaproteobacteria TaxID=1236 RepID=UPI000C778D7D|nr:MULTISPECIES: hypothetical protein [Gammaproteobacteria]MBO9480511.1 hypothetical protein [Salinisphaera sp. G21_0]MBO9494769.1 hypothetical protein [Thalassotalea sp. G20_0]
MPRQKAQPKSTTTKNKQQAKSSNDEWVGLSFRVSPEFSREFKVYAAKNDFKLVDLLKEGFKALKKQRRQSQTR